MVIHSQRCLPDTTPWGTPPPRGRPGPLSARSAPFSAPSIAAGVAVWSLEVEPDHMTPTLKIGRPAPHGKASRVAGALSRARVASGQCPAATPRSHRSVVACSRAGRAPRRRGATGQDDPMALSHV